MKSLFKFILFLAIIAGIAAGSFVLYKNYGQQNGSISNSSSSLISSENTSSEYSSEEVFQGTNVTYNVTTLKLVENVDIKYDNTMKFLEEEGVRYNYSITKQEYQYLYVRATFMDPNLRDLGSTDAIIRFLNNDADNVKEFVSVVYEINYVNSLYVDFYIYMGKQNNYLPDTVLIELKSLDEGYSVGIALIPKVYSMEF